MRREAKAKACVRSRRMCENAFYCRKRRAAAAAAAQADVFTDARVALNPFEMGRVGSGRETN